MKKVIIIIFSILIVVTLSAFSIKSTKTLDGEYYWINEYRNERMFTISGNKVTIDSGEADNFMLNQKNETMELMGSQIITRTKGYIFKYGKFVANISGIKYNCYLKGSEADYKALKKYSYK